MKTLRYPALGLALLLTVILAPRTEAADVGDSARGLAGEHTGGAWESSSEWRNYAQWMDSRWSYIGRIRLNAMRNWSGSALGGLDSSTVYYPFSGPDALYATTLFPDAQYLILGGLEPVGTMPDLAKLQEDGRLPAYLQQMKTALFTILAASFFKTKDMKTDFNNESMNGLVPAIAVFLARQGADITDIQYVTLDRAGNFHPKGEGSGAPAVKFTYDRGGTHTLVYVQADLGNDGLRENPGFVKLMQQKAPGVTYLKAASYLLYEDYFSSIRNAILNNSTGVVEDDSGIPFHFFNQSQWDVIPYGNYTGPIALFREHYQPDLAAYYGSRSHSSLPFGSGYKYVASGSSLLVAKKK